MGVVSLHTVCSRLFHGEFDFDGECAVSHCGHNPRSIANVFPRSLVPTALYIVPVAVLVYYIGNSLVSALSVTSPKAEVKKDI